MTKEFLLTLIVQFIFSGILLFLVQQFIDRKFSSGKLERQNFINAKKELYFQAIEIAYREMAFTGYINPADNQPINNTFRRIQGLNPPSEVELNLIYGKLFLFATNKAIPEAFFDLITHKNIDIT